MANPKDRAVLNSIFNPLLPSSEGIYEEDIPEHLRDDQEYPCSIESKELELEAVKTAESGDTKKAIEIFSKAIDLSPQCPSLYNNRAQAYRLANQVNEAMSDLNNAINLCGKRGKVGCQAYTQRGLLYLYWEKKTEAVEDFKVAAELGSSFSKAMLTQLNPYAALCSQMLGEVFAKYRQGTMDQ